MVNLAFKDDFAAEINDDGTKQTHFGGSWEDANNELKVSLANLKTKKEAKVEKADKNRKLVAYKEKLETVEFDEEDEKDNKDPEIYENIEEPSNKRKEEAVSSNEAAEETESAKATEAKAVAAEVVTNGKVAEKVTEGEAAAARVTDGEPGEAKEATDGVPITKAEEELNIRPIVNYEEKKEVPNFYKKREEMEQAVTTILTNEYSTALDSKPNIKIKLQAREGLEVNKEVLLKPHLNLETAAPIEESMKEDLSQDETVMENLTSIIKTDLPRVAAVSGEKDTVEELEAFIDVFFLFTASIVIFFLQAKFTFHEAGSI